MPPQNGGDHAAALPHSKTKRSAPGRVVPAIPLSLSRPRSTRPQAKVEANPNLGDAQTAAADVVGMKEPEARGVASDTTNQPATTEAHEVNGGMAGHEEQENTRSGDLPAPNEDVVTAVENGVVTDPSLGGAAAETPPANAPVELSTSSTSGTPASARKPTDRFDMRQIKTELPPAFVPSAEQRTPQSATSSHPATHSYAHPTRPSASSIIFGGHDSAGSSPAPPAAAGSAFAPPQHHGRGQFFGHSHHASEPQAQRTYPAGYPQPPMPWQTRSGLSHSAAPPFYHPHAHMPFRYPPRETFIPGGAPVPNGHGPRSRSGSQASSAAQEGQRFGVDVQSSAVLEQNTDGVRAVPSDVRAAYPGHQHRHTLSHYMPPPPPSFPPPEIATGLENAESIRDHILAQFRNPELADCHLQISEQDGDGRQYLEGHRVILARSPTILSLIRSSEAPASATLKTQVHVVLKGQHVRVRPFMEAVRYLYGAPLPPYDTFNLNLSNEERMESALQSIATGAWLSIAAIAHRGVEVAASLLHWDTLPQAFAFALDGGLGQMWPIEDGSEERTSTCSSDDSLTKPEAGGSPTYDPFSSGLLHRTIDFTVQSLPPNFYLDPAAPQLPACPRLPTFTPVHESKSSRSDPRLSKIRFGEIPVEDLQRPSFATTTISSILLSLPFPLLKFLLEHPMLSNRIGAETVASIMRQVVNEREVRRQKALKGRTISHADEGAEPNLVQNLYWEESVEPSQQHRAGFRLARKRRGIDTPPSSGAESEPK